MNILITGGGGLLGSYLNKVISTTHNILTFYHSKPGNCLKYNSLQVDITDYNRIYQLVNDFKPDIIIHCAAASSPKKTEGLPSKEVYKINVDATKQLARLSSLIKAKLIYTSTDLVYAGYRGSMIKEDGKLIPVSLYAETKLMGEEKVKEYADNYLILRTALLYGFGFEGTLNHFDLMYNNLKNKKPVKLFHDQFRTPLSIHDATRIILQLLQLKTGNEIINFGGYERISRFELGEMLCNAAGFDCSLIEKISMYDIPGISDVPDVSMNTDKLQSYGIRQKSIYDSIYEILYENNSSKP
jgi:dTDP-4-dehydrorhamnose reductase